MRFVYQAIVLYLAIHLVWALFRENDFWKRAAAALVLLLFGLRLFFIQ